MATVDPAAQDNYIYNRLLKERIIWLGSEVRDENANAICSQLLLLSAENPEKDIYLYINSPGGSVTAGMAIYDTMQFIPNDVVTVATGFMTAPSALQPIQVEPNSELMTVLPMVLIPVFLVPLSIMLHLASLAKLHRSGDVMVHA